MPTQCGVGVGVGCTTTCVGVGLGVGFGFGLGVGVGFGFDDFGIWTTCVANTNASPLPGDASGRVADTVFGFEKMRMSHKLL